MRPRVASRLSVAMAVATVGAATAAPGLAAAPTGSSAAVKLSRAVVSHQNRQVALSVKQSGGYYECPRAHAFPKIVLSAHRPARNCVKTSLRAKENLRRGGVTSSLLEHTARGKPAIYTLSEGARQWERLQGSSCWKRLPNQAPVKQTVTYEDEQLTILGAGPKRVTMKGVSSGFVEIDILGAHNHALLEAFDTVETAAGTVHIHLSFGYPRTRFRLPSPEPVCN